jgi:hypothetical protein
MILSDEERAKFEKECHYRYDLEREGRRKGITKEVFKEFLTSAVISKLRNIDFKNKFQEEEQDLDLKVSIIKIPKEEQKKKLDRKIVKEAQERMTMILEAKRL